MSLPLHAIATGTFAPVLRSLSGVLDKAAAHARETGADPDALLEARLAPDMFPFKLQVRFACFQARQGIARLMGEEAPADEGPEATIEDLKAGIARAVAYVESAPVERFEDCADRKVSFHVFGDTWFEGSGLEHLRDWSLAHFYFHAVTAYDILRAAGAPIGKADYVGHVGYALRQKAA